MCDDGAWLCSNQRDLFVLCWILRREEFGKENRGLSSAFERVAFLLGPLRLRHEGGEGNFDGCWEFEEDNELNRGYNLFAGINGRQHPEIHV